MRQYNLHTIPTNSEKHHCHVNNSTKSCTTTGSPDNISDDSEQIFNSGNAPVLSESSSSEYESDCDLLTPEEAFHLPPGSLPFPAELNDDDDLCKMRSDHMRDDEDMELMSCTSNFILDPAKQNMINHELSSPTLNDLSEFDQSFGMFLSNTDTLSPTSPVATLSPMVSLSLPSSSSVLSQHSNIFEQSTPSTCANSKGQSTRSLSSVSMNNSSNNEPNTSRGVSTKCIRPPITSCIGSSTLLKISPLNMTSQAFRNSTLKPNNGLTHPLIHKQFKQATLSVDNRKNYTLINSQSKSTMKVINQSKNESTIHGDISEEETPFEKVNPDIYFTSAYPVWSGQPDI